MAAAVRVRRAGGAGWLAARLLAAASEGLQLTAQTSPHPARWVALHKSLAVPFLLRGRLRAYQAEADGAPLRVLCIGRERSFRPLLERLLSGVTGGDPLSSGNLWAARNLRGMDSDLTVIEIHPWAARRFRQLGWQVVPTAVRWRAPLAAIPPRRPSKSLRSDMAKIQAAGYQAEIVRKPSPADYHELYREMVLPLVRRRFGDDAWHPTPTYLRQIRSRSTLLFVTDGGRRLGGTFLIRTLDQILMPLLGVRDGDPDLVRTGVVAAIYSASADCGRRSGAKWMDIGRTTPFHRDGLARYKRKWGFSPTPDPLSPVIGLWTGSRHAGLAAALRRQPFMTLDGPMLGCLPR
jgi:hypothetical protein